MNNAANTHFSFTANTAFAGMNKELAEEAIQLLVANPEMTEEEFSHHPTMRRWGFLKAEVAYQAATAM